MVMEGKQTWPVYDREADAWLGKVCFKGGSKTTQNRTIPAQTAEEANLLNSATTYANGTGNIANGMLSNISNLSNQAGTAYNNYNNTAQGITSGYSDLTSGILPTSYATARHTALNNDLNSTIGSAINNLASRGILNSSVTNSALNQISSNAADTLANNYSTDLNNYSNLLGSASANNTSNLSNYENALSSLTGTNDTLADNTANLFNTMYSGRMGTSGTTSSTSGGNSTASLIGQLGTAAILFCFVGGTQIATPDGNKDIKDIQLGDKVYSLNGVIETVIEVQEPQISPNEYMIVETKTSEVRPTSTQPFITTDGDFLPGELVGKELIGFDGNEVVVSVEVNPVKETVYDFKTTGSNTYFANGFLVRGR